MKAPNTILLGFLKPGINFGALGAKYTHPEILITVGKIKCIHVT
jgi:hypothetical protein